MDCFIRATYFAFVTRLEKLLLFMLDEEYNSYIGGSVVTHETRIREVPGSSSGADQPDWGFFVVFPQSPRQMLGWIFITTIHLTIIHQIHISYIIYKLKSVNLTNETLTTQQ